MGSGESKNQNPQLKEFCQKVQNMYKDIHQDDTIKEVQFKKYFKNRKVFASYLYKYCKLLKPIQQNFYLSFELLCQILLLNEEHISNEKFQNHGLNIFQILIQISRGLQIQDKQPIKRSEISQINGLFASLIFTDSSKSEQKNLFTQILQLLTNDKEEIYFEIVLQKFQNLFPVLIIYLRNLVDKIIFQKPINEEQFDKDNLMTFETFKLLQMCNSKLWQYPQKQLIYSSIKQGSSFHRFAQSLKGLQCPIIILIQNKYNTMKAQDNIGIFGAMTTCEWNDSLAYFGNPETFLFSIEPKFRTFFTFNGKGSRNYVYLNTKKINNSVYNVGLGFGGENNEFHRIWIDQNFLKQSKIYDYGNTFGEGSLSDSPDEYLQVLQIEVWGFPSKEDLQMQEQFRFNENQIIMNNRKIDKKQMFGVGTEFLLEKQFKFKEQMNIDFEYEKQKMND